MPQIGDSANREEVTPRMRSTSSGHYGFVWRRGEHSTRRGVEYRMTDKEPRRTPIGYEDGPDKPTRSAFRITALAIGIAAVVCLALIVVVVVRRGGI